MLQKTLQNPKENLKKPSKPTQLCYDTLIIQDKIMTLSRATNQDLTNDEWNELVALKDAINYNPSQVSPDKMERFTSLLVQSLEGKGDNPLNA